MALDIMPTRGGWFVKSDASPHAAKLFDSKAEAIEAARSLIHSKGGALRIHGRDGRMQESVTLGRQAAAKISAVEGISLEGEVRRDLEAFDREDLSPQERRRRIGVKYAMGPKVPR